MLGGGAWSVFRVRTDWKKLEFFCLKEDEGRGEEMIKVCKFMKGIANVIMDLLAKSQNI